MGKPDAPKLEDCDKVLIVEGYSDLVFYAEFLEFFGRIEGVFIKKMTGRDHLEKELQVFLTPKLLSQKSHIAVIIDADDDGIDAAKRIAGRLKASTGYDLTEGTWAGDNPKIGFFVTPCPGEVGELENLVWSAWANAPQNAEAAKCVETFIQCMEPTAPAKTERVAKRYLGSMLAVRHEDDPRVGPAAKKRTDPIFDFNAPEFARLRTFLSGF